MLFEQIKKQEINCPNKTSILLPFIKKHVDWFLKLFDTIVECVYRQEIREKKTKMCSELKLFANFEVLEFEWERNYL